MKRQSGPFMTIIFACAALLAAAFAAVIATLPAARAQGQPIRLVALGDSLSAGYNLPQEAAFPTVLERALKAKGYKVEIANAGVSGDTSSGGLDRLDWSVPDGTDGVILELGANDMLRGLDPVGTRKSHRDHRRAAQKPQHPGDARGHGMPRAISARLMCRNSTASIRTLRRRTTLCSIPSSWTESPAIGPSTCPTGCTRRPRASRSSSSASCPASRAFSPALPSAERFQRLILA